MSEAAESEVQTLANPYSSVVLPELGEDRVPDVSVVIICYNDAEHLPSAVESVRIQTLENVEILICDDHSTDDTPAVAAALCAEDSRISYHRLEVNSGGCGGPRNRGIREARGRYLMFLDSDDQLERHACKNMMLAAERDGSELVTGLMQRRYLDGSGIREPWYGWLYTERRLLQSIADFPELIHDTTATNKLYRREFFDRTGLRFPEDMHYEDIAFSAKALCSARGISVIPEYIYFWNVYPSETRESITNQRDDEKNLRDRMFAIDIAQSEYEAVSDELREEMELKILKHHLRLYLNDIPKYDDERAAAIVHAVLPYVEKINLETVEKLNLGERALYAALFTGDIEAVKRCMLVGRHGSVGGEVVAAEGGAFWRPGPSGERPVGSPMAAALSDFSQTHYVEQAHTQISYAYVLTEVNVENDKLILRGIASDPLGKLKLPGSALRIGLRKFGEGTTFSDYVPLVAAGDQVTWSVELPLPRRNSLRERADREFYVDTRLAGGSTNSAPLRMAPSLEGELQAIVDRTLMGRMLRDRWSFQAGFRDMALLKVDISPWGDFVRRTAKGAVKYLPGRKWMAARLDDLRNPYSSLNRDTVYPLMRRFPIKDDLALFEANMGSSVFDNPRAVFEQLRRSNPEINAVWAVNGNPRLDAELGSAPRVQRGSLRYLWMLARAKYIVDNQSLPNYFVKRDEQRYLQTWHGIPYKKIGFDLVLTMSKQEQKRVSEAVAAWDGLVSPSDYFEEVFLPAFDYHGPLIRGGYPRNDVLLQLAERKRELRAKLDIGADRKVVLYAPTFRDGTRGKRDEELHFDIEKWDERFGDDVTLLIRSHYLNRFSIPERFKGRCIDVSDYGDVAELYAISDVLVTDYSSVMFDFALLGRPIVIFAPDYEEFTTQSRGAYFDLSANAPGAFTLTEDEMFNAVRAGLSADTASAELLDFRRKFCGEEDGRASERAVQFLLSGGNS
ncbi:bifunctional glycosyltransferase/CDP-glycerol:glycerophosphate glycerophosphotransferase [Leucobacter tenebrionis]|uniref:bifunctional glycosyltransferase/CDP-glycerol:glycerophosphate glycerophosphotransferase n=1 Tax=Leucobacter tenebrionis TaxID=2873270 RepID=UPI001CA66BF5|nr:CDP-glycerol glycerophosphotransferase family protein [Leucobacter tenebrionis]QZY51158.1 bifunctional glycosyltransferase family 2 protein/CDP-glycerol:glycerophosphate glycerophosphotransferase [Leucobacter tenebrionis]